MERRDRGQLFVVAALALAVLIVGVALLLNSGVYGANLAAQNAEGGVEEPREFLREAEIGANRVMSHANYNNFSSYDDLRRNFTLGVHNWSERTHHHRALSGEGVEIREVNVSNGTRVTQDTDDRKFLNNGRASNWTVATGLGGVRQFRMNVTTATLPNTTSVQTRNDYLSSSYFRINVTPEGGTTKRIYIYGNSTGEAALVRVAGGPSDLSPPCKAAANENDRVTLYISDGLIGQEHCEALDFLDDPTTPFAINYTNGENIEGSYELFLDESFSSVNDGDYGTDPNGDPPGIERAIYDATLDVNYTAEHALLNGNRTATPDRRRFIGGGEAFTFSIPVGDNVTFQSGGNEITTLNKQGSSSQYSGFGGNPRAIGPTAVDVYGSNEFDTPFTTTAGGGRLRVYPGNNELASDPVTGNPQTVGVGSWNGGGPSVFYVATGGPTDSIHQANETGSEEAFTPPNDAVAVAGIANVTPDDSDIVYANANQDIMYRDNGTSSEIIDSSNINWNTPPPVGTPGDFDGDGTARVPFVNDTNDLALAGESGPITPIPTAGDTPLNVPMATLDWDDDGALDIIFINNSGSGHLKVVYNVTGTNTVRPVNDTSGNPVTVSDTTLGVR